MIDLAEVGAHAQPPTDTGVEISLGLYLPGITFAQGYEVHVLILHKSDHFAVDIAPRDFALNYMTTSSLDLWQTTIWLEREENTHFGLSGTYLYRYQLLQSVPDSDEKRVVTQWFTDPFALATDIGLLSAVATPDSLPEFHWTDEQWKVPEHKDLVIYELHVEEFNSNFEGIIERLPYLKGLGVNCIELMPITSLKLNFDWGYAPLHYFAPYERWGGVSGLKRLVNACHEAGVAVILDVVYQHVDPSFPYSLIYRDAGLDSPMIGGDGPFGPEINFHEDFARDYLQKAHFHWMYQYHIDGFRYDEVTDLYDGPMGIQYAQIAYNTYNESLKIARFTPSGAPGEYSRLIQISEAQNRPQEVLRDTYTSGTWQDGLLCMAEDMAQQDRVDENFVSQIILDDAYAGYPATKEVRDSEGQPVAMPVYPVQYFENHDHSRLITYIETLHGDIPSGNRALFYKLQPFAIALYTCVGIPMLWQGQEFAENYVVPPQGEMRINFQRNVRWENFYDDAGAPLVRLYRTLAKLRQTYPALRSRESFYYREESRLDDRIVAYRRELAADGQVAQVILNFSDSPQTITLPFPAPGTYREMISHTLRAQARDITVQEANQRLEIEVPAHYGAIYLNM